MSDKLAIGLMSGTSMDGVDAALIKTDGRHSIRSLAHYKLDYTQSFRLILKASEYAVVECKGDISLLEKHFKRYLDEYFHDILKINGDQWALLCEEIEKELKLEALAGIEYQHVIDHSSRCHIQAVKGLLDSAALSMSDIDVIGYHGQTFYHAPELGVSYQVANVELLANTLKTKVIHDFRQNDIDHGGQGAPFAPVYHQALAVRDNLLPAAIVNCGGIANITLIYGNEEQDVIGYDCGPGNVLIDQWVRMHKPHFTMDVDGQFGQNGCARPEIIRQLYQSACCRADYFNQVPPKSLDSSDFRLPSDLEAYTFEDVCASLEHFTADVIVTSLESIHKPVPKNWILCGGGWNNPIIYQAFNRALASRAKVNICMSDDIGWDSSCLEAEIFAYLAVRSLLGLPLSYPSTTGVSKSVTGGELFVPSGQGAIS